MVGSILRSLEIVRRIDDGSNLPLFGFEPMMLIFYLFSEQMWRWWWTYDVKYL